jgi:hypothetical protein
MLLNEHLMKARDRMMGVINAAQHPGISANWFLRAKSCRLITYLSFDDHQTHASQNPLMEYQVKTTRGVLIFRYKLRLLKKFNIREPLRSPVIFFLNQNEINGSGFLQAFQRTCRCHKEPAVQIMFFGGLHIFFVP